MKNEILHERTAPVLGHRVSARARASRTTSVNGIGLRSRLAEAEAGAAAITARDAQRAVAHYAPEVVSFTRAPPLRYAGDEARDPAGIEGWFGTWGGPIG
jgi:hypothetical protein